MQFFYDGLSACRSGDLKKFTSSLEAADAVDIASALKDSSIESLCHSAFRSAFATEIFKTLIPALIKVEPSFKPYNTLISEAAHLGRLDLVQLFLDFGGDVNAGGIFPSPLMISCIHSEENLFLLLLSYGPEINTQAPAKDREAGKTALHFATRHHHLTRIQLLVEAGADLTLQDSKGKTVKDLAYDLHFTDAIQFLMSYEERQQLNQTLEKVPRRNKSPL